MKAYYFLSILCIVSMLTFVSGTQAEGATITSAQTGNWTTGSTWVGGSVPSNSDNAIIANGHTVTLVSSRSIVALTINSGGTLAGGGFTLTVSGNFVVNGTYSGTGAITLTGSGTTIDGTGSITNTSTLTISTGSKSILATANLTFAGTIAISGTRTVTNNGIITTSAAGGMTGSASGSTWVNAANAALNIAGPLLATGTLTATASPNTMNYNGAGAQTIKSTTYHHLTLATSGAKTAGGNLTLNGDLTLADAATFNGGTSRTHTLRGSWNINTSAVTPFAYTTSSTINFNTPGTAATTSLSGTSSATIAFNIVNINNTSGFTANLNLSASGNLTVGAGVTLTPAAAVIISGTGTLTGSGTVQVTRTAATADFASQYTITTKTLTSLTVDYAASGQVLSDLTYGSGGSGGLEVSGSITGSNTATVGGALTVTGTLTPSSGEMTMNSGSSIVNSGALTFRGLTIAASATVTTSSSFAVEASLTIGTGASFTASAGTISVSGGAITGAGSLTFSSLTVAAATSPSKDLSVNGTLTLNYNLVMGSNTLTMGPSSLTVGTADVAGNVKRTTFASNTTYTFGNQFTSLRFTPDGTLPTDVTIAIATGTAPAEKTDAILRTYTITQTGGSNYSATLRFHYLDSELNGNTESKLTQWDLDGSIYDDHGKSNSSSTDNWVEEGNISDIPTVWTLADETAGASIWLGESSSDWTDPINWNGGLPHSNDHARIPNATTTTYDPTLPASTTITGLEIDNGGVLNGGTGTSLSVKVSWINHGAFNAGTSTVVFDSIAMLDGTTDFYNLTVGSAGFLSVEALAVMRIAGTFTNNGTFDARGHEETVVEYNGGNQTVINPNGPLPGYETLLLSSSSGSVTKTMPATTLVFDDYLALSTNGTALSVTAGNTFAITEEFSIGANTTFDDGGFSHTIGSDWINNGTYTASGTITLTGSLPASASASNFNNLVVNKTSATATLTGNASIAGNLTISGGTFDLGSYTANRATSGGTLSLSSGAALRAGGSSGGVTGSNFPNNYTTNTLSGTVEYNGSGGQTIPAFTYNNLTISGARTSNNVTLASSGTIAISGTFGPTATFTTGGYVNTGSTIDYNGTIAQTVSALNYNNLTISGTRTSNNVTLASTTAIGVSGIFAPSATFTTGGYVATGTTIEYNGSGDQTIVAFGYNNLTSSSTGARTLASSGTIAIDSVFTPGTNAYTITGSTIMYCGSSAQAAPSAFSTYENLTINNSSGSTLGGNTTVSGTLTLSAGNLTTGANTLTLGTSASSVGTLSRTSGTIVGNFARWVAASTVTDVLFPVGMDANYRPANASFTAAPSVGGTLTAFFTEANPGTNGLPIDDGGTSIVNCGDTGFWTIAAGDGLTGGTYSLDLTADGFGGVSDYTTLRILKRADALSSWTLDGAHAVGTGSNTTPVVHRTGMSGFSEFGIGGASDNALPIQLSSFTATQINQTTVRLEWTTLTELNNYGFEVQKSDTTQHHYQTILNSFIPGHGTTNETQRYSYLDVTATRGIWYYRLKQIDLDGSIHYSDGIRVDMLTGVLEEEIPTVFSLSQNYPNPFNPSTIIRYGLPYEASVRLTVYNLLGQQVAEPVNEHQRAGYHDVVFRGDGFASGLYFYRLDAGKYTSVKRLMLVK
jgi:hypothetical protein